MFSLNRVNIIGYQTQPVQIRQTPGGTSVTDLNVVVPYSFKTESGEMLDGKAFHTVTLWGPMAEVAGKFVKPGAQLFLSGRLQTDSWQDEKTNEKRSKTKIVALDLILLDSKEGQKPAPEGAAGLIQCVNRADVIGNVTRDPEMRTTTSGQQVLTLGVATNEKWRDKASGTDKERTEFHNVVLWGAQAEQVSKHVRKGNRVYVSGRVQTRSWETKEGSKRYTTEIIADTVTLLGTSHPAAIDAIRNEGRDQGISSQASSRSEPMMNQGSVASESYNQDVPQVETAAVAYASEIKPEDLPF